MKKKRDKPIEVPCQIIDAKNGVIKIPRTFVGSKTHWELLLNGKTMIGGKIVRSKKRKLPF